VLSFGQTYPLKESAGGNLTSFFHYKSERESRITLQKSKLQKSKEQGAKSKGRKREACPGFAL